MRKGFTLIELLIVIAIISVLVGIGMGSYQSAIKSTRDARRRTDLESLRGALELYRSNNNVYPATLDVSCVSTAGITDATNTYLAKTPHDPGCTQRSYSFSSTSSDYTIGAALEGGSTTGSCGTCGSVACNYCVGPFGEK